VLRLCPQPKEGEPTAVQWSTVYLFLHDKSSFDFFLSLISGNRTPGSRSYADLVDTWADSTSSYQPLFKRLPIFGGSLWLIPINAQ